MEEESLDHIVLSEDATVRDSLRALYGTAFKAASFSVGDKTCLISKDELVTALEKGLGDLPLRRVISSGPLYCTDGLTDEELRLPLLRVKDGTVIVNEAAKKLIDRASIELCDINESSSECAMLHMDNGSVISIEPVGNGYFVVKELGRDEVEEMLGTARWAAIGKALWNYLEAKDMALKVEEREKRGAVPLRWNGLDLGFLTCRKKRKSPSKGKEPKNGSSSG